MNCNDTDDLNRTEEEILAYEVSDEAMEAASDTHKMRPDNSLAYLPLHLSLELGVTRADVTTPCHRRASNELCQSSTARRRRADRSPVVKNPALKNASNSNIFALSLALKAQWAHYLPKSELASDREV
jgi:hypothetical protein